MRNSVTVKESPVSVELPLTLAGRAVDAVLITGLKLGESETVMFP